MSKYKLYGTAMTGTCAIHAALEELGIPYELVEISTSKGHQNTEEYRKINPRQQVPSLMLPDGQVVTEGPAILMHLADAHPEANLAPACGTTERSQINRWLLFFSVNVYEGELRKIVGHQYTTDPDGGEAVKASAIEYVNRHYEIFETVLGDGPYFLNNNFTILDIYVWMLAQWMDANWLKDNCPKILRLADIVKARPAVAPVHKLNFG
jgi:glutathione S-transferase